MRKVLLNVAVGTGHYQRSAARQLRSIEAVGETCDRIARTDYPPGCPTHQEQPFAFKPYIFKEARELGYTHALWLDSTCVVHKPLGAVWDAIDTQGAFFWNSGYASGQWCSDRCLEGMGVTRDEAWRIPMIQATVIGLKFDADRGFLDQWLQFVPLFHGAWKNRGGEVSTDPKCDGHRHDQSVASILVHRLGFSMVEPPICVYDGVTEETVFQNLGPGR